MTPSTPPKPATSSQRRHATQTPAAGSAFDEIKTLVAGLHDLHRQMVLAYSPIVQRIIANGSLDVHEIEHTLDRLLTCAGHPEGLLLFKSLCRYYYGIDPTAAAQHIYFYREWYEDQESEAGAKAPSCQVAESDSLGQATAQDMRGLGYGA